MSSFSVFAPDRPLVLLGAGKMGGAMLARWLELGLAPESVVVIDPSPPPDSQAILDLEGIVPYDGPPADRKAALIVLAVKPQIIKGLLPGLRALVDEGTVALSIAAGATLASLEEGLGPMAIVRSIPNTPALVGRGITVAIANRLVDPAGRALAAHLLEAVGEVAWVDDEALIDAATAVSGSGPAYVFLLAECLAEAAVAAGIEPDLAGRLARATVTGAGELLHRSDLSPEELRRNVTSPAGTTAAALTVLMAGDGLGPLMIEAVAAAKKRARELSG